MSSLRMAVRNDTLVRCGTVRLSFCYEVRYVYFVMVRVRYVGTVRRFCKGTGTVRWYALLIKTPRLFAHYAGFLYTEAKNR